jgi:hypothetical protein
MKRFVIRQNIEHYRAMLTVTPDPAQRLQIEKLPARPLERRSQAMSHAAI